MIVTFCGHSEIGQGDEVERWLLELVPSLIAQGADTFYPGGYGAFDELAAAVLQKLKPSYPHIHLVLVLAYWNRKRNISGYDFFLYPNLDRVPPRFAIPQRNRRMVELSDAVVAYVTHDWGGAAKTLAYAKQKKKKLYPFRA